MPSILETFYILFESNAEQAKKGVQDAEKATDSFDKKLGSSGDHVNMVGAKITETFKGVGAAIAAAFAVEKIREFILVTAELNDQLGKFAKSIDEDIGEVYAWGEAAARSGGSAEGFQSSLSALNRGMADMAAKGRSRLSPFFDELGIKMLDSEGKVKPLLKLLPELAGAFEKISKQESSGYGEKLGLDVGTLMLLQSGRRAVEDLVERQRQLGTVTEHDSEVAEKFNDQWDDTKQIFRGIATAIGSFILPAFTAGLQIVEKFFRFFSNHKGLIEGVFIGAAGLITTLYLPAIWNAVRATAIWLAEMALAALPFVAIAAAIGAVIAAFAFLYDDVMNFLQGNNSVIGELSKKWPWIGETVKAVAKDIAAVFQWVIDTGAALVNFFVQLGGLIGATIGAGIRIAVQAFEWFAAAGRKALHGLAVGFPYWAKVVHAMGDGVMATFRAIGGVWEWLVGLIKKSIGWVLETIGMIPKALGKWGKDVGKVTAVVATVAQPAAAVAQDKPKPAPVAADAPQPGKPRQPAPVAVAGRPQPSAPEPKIVAQDKPKPAPVAVAGRPQPSAPEPKAADAGRPVRHEEPRRSPPVASAAEQHEEARKIHHTVQAVASAQKQIASADATPLASHTTNAINQSRRIEKKVTVQTGPITVNTQATDAAGVAKELGGHLRDQMRQAVNHFDDGVDT